MWSADQLIDYLGQNTGFQEKDLKNALFKKILGDIFNSQL